MSEIARIVLAVSDAGGWGLMALVIAGFFIPLLVIAGVLEREDRP